MVNWNLAVSESLPLLAEGKQTAPQSAGTADRVSVLESFFDTLFYLMRRGPMPGSPLVLGSRL